MSENKSHTPQVIDQKKIKPYYLLAVITAFLVLLATCGSFILKDVYKPFVPDHLLPEAYGQDLLSLLSVPLLMFSLFTARRNSVRGLLLLNGILLYIAYAYALYAFGAVYNSFFLVYIALVGLPIFAVSGFLTHIQSKIFQSQVKNNFPVKAVSIYLSSHLTLF